MATRQNKGKEIIIAPSLLSANLANLAEATRGVASEADWLHFDVMDGQYVPNLTFGAPVCKALRTQTKLFLDVHLMVYHPENFLEDFVAAGANSFVFHYEATQHAQRLLQRVKQAGLVAGIALNPGTPVAMLEDLLLDLDLILLMSVNPGFSGQTFIPQSLEKIQKCRQMIDAVSNQIYLQVDGGVNQNNIKAVCDAGADVIVVGQAGFGQPDPALAIKNLRQALTDKQ